jgi:putative endonuclease
MRIYYVYMLLCSDDTYYVGVTNDIERRFAEHCDAVDTRAYTRSRLPLQLVYVEEFQWVQDAIEWEKKLKKWSRAKKKALIDENWDRIKELAVCKNASSHRHFNIGID